MLSYRRETALGVTAEELQANIGWKSAISLQRGSVDPKFQVEGVAVTNHSSSQKTRLKWSFVWYKSMDRSFYRIVTKHEFDRRTDGQTDSILIARPRLHSMQRGKNVALWLSQQERAEQQARIDALLAENEQLRQQLDILRSHCAQCAFCYGEGLPSALATSQQQVDYSYTMWCLIIIIIIITRWLLRRHNMESNSRAPALEVYWL